MTRRRRPSPFIYERQSRSSARPSMSLGFFERHPRRSRPLPLMLTADGAAKHIDMKLAKHIKPIGPQTRSPFLALPPELRKRIYDFALVADVQIDYHCNAMVLSKVQAYNAGLMLVSKQIYKETIGLYYPLTTFWCNDDEEMIGWWQMLRKGTRDKIKNVKLVCVVKDGMRKNFKDMVVDRACRSFSIMGGIAKTGEIQLIEEGDVAEGFEPTMVWKV